MMILPSQDGKKSPLIWAWLKEASQTPWPFPGVSWGWSLSQGHVGVLPWAVLIQGFAVVGLVTSPCTVNNDIEASHSKFLNLLFNGQGQSGCWYWTLGAGVGAAHVGAPPLAWEGSVWAGDWPPRFNPTLGAEPSWQQSQKLFD